MMIGCATLHDRKVMISSYAEPSSPYYVYGRHGMREESKNSTKKYNVIFILIATSNSRLCNTASGFEFVKLKAAMVGERIRREPWGESEKWKGKGKV